MERALAAVDELSGFVLACAYVRPEGLHRDDPQIGASKKLKQPSFAAAVNREDVTRGAQELGVELDQLIEQVIAALAPHAGELGVGGAAGLLRPARARRREAPTAARPRLSRRRLEQLDRVAGGSSSRICLPPTPVTMSLRKRRPASRSVVDGRVEVVDLEHEPVPAARLGLVPSGIACPPPPAPLGALSASRRSPRVSIANVGAGCITSSKPSCSQ